MNGFGGRKLHVGFTGTKRGMTREQKHRLQKFLTVKAPHEFHHGDCVGADAEAHHIAFVYGADIVVHPPTNTSKMANCKNATRLPPKPYIERNHDIVDAVDVVVAAPGERDEQLRSGTWATIRYARKQGKQVYILFPDGKIEVQ